jgi:hypothetical protein
MSTKWLNYKTRFIILTFLSPGLWWTISQTPAVVSRWISYPRFVYENITSTNRLEWLTTLDELKWAGVFIHRNNFLSKILYQKLDLVPKEMFEFSEFISPRFYFVTGDGSQFTPSRVEPISTLLFPFWLVGILQLIKQKKFKPLLLAIGVAFIAYLAGKKDFGFLWPNLIIFTYIANIGIELFPTNYKKGLSLFLIVYGIYILEMSIWLRQVS